VVCQRDGIFRQMELGVRYIDLRVTSDLRMCHGLVLLWGTLDNVLWEIRRFLHYHPSETALVSVKLDDGDSADKIAITVENWWKDNNWYHDNRWPTLGEVRGKLVLLKRFADHHKTPDGYGFRGLFGNKTMGPPAPWDQPDEGTQAGMDRFKRWEMAAMNTRRVKELPIDDGAMHFTTLADVADMKVPLYYADYMKKYEYWLKTMQELTIDPNSRRFGIICSDFLDESVGNTIVQKTFSIMHGMLLYR
ncbi:PLC-like phosphodiesterase, partial [Ilyonectria destructans]